MPRVLPTIKDFELFHTIGDFNCFYARMRGEGSVNAIFINYDDSNPIFTREGVLDPTDGPYKLSLGLSKGTSSGVVATVKETIEQVAEKLNKYADG